MSQTNPLMGNPRVEKRIKLVPPDGGWGWMVLLGTAVTNIFNQSMLSLFSLLYGDTLEAMGHNTQGAAVVMSTMLFVSNFGGPIAGAVINLTTPRCVAVLGALSCSLGILVSGFATNIWHLIISYGILLGLGLGFIQNSTFTAINSYFLLRKSLAVGISNAGTGVGQSVMPHVVRYLLKHYGFRSACMLLAAMSFHGVAATLLIQPVEWHMKKVEVEIIVDEKSQLLDDKNKDIKIVKANNPCDAEYGDVKIISVPKPVTKNGIANGSVKEKTLIKKMYDLLDISLLSSFRFINIIVGVALILTSIQNFSLLFPLFLQKVANMDKQQTTICMSAVALVDICGRLLLPVLQDKYKITARVMLTITSAWIVVVRQILSQQTEASVILAVSCFYGLGKSTVAYCRNLAVSEFCKLERVPAAVGLSMLATGIILPPLGYFLGWIRDYTDSYVICLTAQDALLMLCLIMWVPDLIIIFIQDRRKRRRNLEVVELS